MNRELGSRKIKGSQSNNEARATGENASNDFYEGSTSRRENTNEKGMAVDEGVLPSPRAPQNDRLAVPR